MDTRHLLYLISIGLSIVVVIFMLVMKLLGSSGAGIPEYEIKTKEVGTLLYVNMLRMLKNSENIWVDQHACIKKIYESSDKE